ncbi:hypothetical protein TMatcc_001751 [Talaromyces marneffei ATCC 18224]|uniref:Uncharacterized protein n=2 Tax=Talaromyces marneffei TaxID=37727 RepID=B6QHP6_TALMQ|nr:uncharacterized protein EYB26_007046 [Talaromyces marneffei]EEA22891.1 hypothetical protein PMAA_094960 [Talaromyces marneffei ATCC 18224]KAE8551769.1 hypothetical protein EYB25_005659 [Talaromyces marneffei]QGA19357.1 hypothetical protein EYB26_007046 [Talaromyces marneffei]
MARISHKPAKPTNSREPEGGSYNARQKRLIDRIYEDVPVPSQNTVMYGVMRVSHQAYDYTAEIEVTKDEIEEVTWISEPQVEVSYYADLKLIRTAFIQTKFSDDYHKGVKLTDRIYDLQWLASLIIVIKFEGGTLEDIPEIRKMAFPIYDRRHQISGMDYDGTEDPLTFSYVETPPTSDHEN